MGGEVSVVRFFQHPSEGVAGHALIRHSDSMLRVVVSKPPAFGMRDKEPQPLVGGVHCTVGVGGEMIESSRTALMDKRCQGELRGMVAIQRWRCGGGDGND